MRRSDVATSLPQKRMAAVCALGPAGAAGDVAPVVVAAGGGCAAGAADPSALAAGALAVGIVATFAALAVGAGVAGGDVAAEPPHAASQHQTRCADRNLMRR